MARTAKKIMKKKWVIIEIVWKTIMDLGYIFMNFYWLMIYKFEFEK